MGFCNIIISGNEPIRFIRLLRVINEIYLKLDRYGQTIKDKFELESIEDFDGVVTIVGVFHLNKHDAEILPEFIKRLEYIWEGENETYCNINIRLKK